MKYLLTILLLFTLSIPLANAETFGFISDLHAGKQKIRKGLRGRPSDKPSKAVATTRKYIKAMQKQGVDMIISAGDNTNNRDNKYAKKMIGFPVVWTMGNHDYKKSILAPQRYYSKETANFRIIILDSNYGSTTGAGQVPQWELDWLKEQLKTDKKIIVVLHHPAMPYLKDVLVGSNTVAVFNGHIHVESEYRENGIWYKTLPPLVRGYRTYKF